MKQGTNFPERVSYFRGLNLADFDVDVSTIVKAEAEDLIGKWRRTIHDHEYREFHDLLQRLIPELLDAWNDANPNDLIKG